MNCEANELILREPQLSLLSMTPFPMMSSFFLSLLLSFPLVRLCSAVLTMQSLMCSEPHSTGWQSTRVSKVVFETWEIEVLNVGLSWPNLVWFLSTYLSYYSLTWHYFPLLKEMLIETHYLPCQPLLDSFLPSKDRDPYQTHQATQQVRCIVLKSPWMLSLLVERQYKDRI